MAPAPDRICILVVDDEPAVLSIVRRILAHSGYEALAAPDAETAINLCRQHRQSVSLALIDFMMPVTDGPATVAALRQICPSIRVSMMSGYSRETLAERGLSPDIPFLPKPFKPTELLEFIKSAIGGLEAGTGWGIER